MGISKQVKTSDSKCEPKIIEPESLEAKFHLMHMAPLDRRMKRKHLAVYGFILDWFHQKYGDSLASVRFIVSALKERDPEGVGLYMGDVHTALTDLVAWGYLECQIGTGRNASRYIPIWSKQASVRKIPNASDVDICVRENQNACVRENQNTTDVCVLKSPNEDPFTGPGLQTRVHVNGNECEAAPMAPPSPPAGAVDEAGSASGGLDSFQSFWNVWPRKHGKKKTETEWQNVDSTIRKAVIEAASIWAGHYARHGTDKKWIPEPANWLKGERWDEDLPLVHIDAKGAAIAKAKANASTAKNPKPANGNVLSAAPAPVKQSIALVCDVGPRSPVGTFNATILGSVVDPITKKIALHLSWTDPENGPDAVHTFHYEHPNNELQDRGQAFLGQIANALGFDQLDDAEQLAGQQVRCTINSSRRISYQRITENDNPHATIAA